MPRPQKQQPPLRTYTCTGRAFRPSLDFDVTVEARDILAASRKLMALPQAKALRGYCDSILYLEDEAWIEQLKKERKEFRISDAQREWVAVRDKWKRTAT